MKALLLILCLVGLSGCVKFKKRSLFEIPEGFSGWVLVQFEKNGAAPLPERDGERIVTIGRNGRAVTSSPLEEGWSRLDEFYFVGSQRTKISVSEHGAGGQVWSQANGAGYTIFFIGSEQEFEKAKLQYPHPE